MASNRSEEDNKLPDPENQSGKYRWIIWVLAIAPGIIGLGVLIWFAVVLWQNFELHGKFLPQATGVTGDFIGGVVGTMWSLTGILLFYLAIAYQRDDLRNNRRAIQMQTRELGIQAEMLG